MPVGSDGHWQTQSFYSLHPPTIALCETGSHREPRRRRIRRRGPISGRGLGECGGGAGPASLREAGEALPALLSVAWAAGSRQSPTFRARCSSQGLGSTVTPSSRAGQKSCWLRWRHSPQLQKQQGTCRHLMSGSVATVSWQDSPCPVTSSVFLTT